MARVPRRGETRPAVRLPRARSVPPVGRGAGQLGEDPRRPVLAPDHRQRHRPAGRPGVGGRSDDRPAQHGRLARPRTAVGGHRTRRGGTGPAPRRAVVGDGDRRGARPRVHQAAPRRAARAPWHLPGARPSRRDRAPVPARGHGRRAVAGGGDRGRAAAPGARSLELLGLRHPRLPRPARRLREPGGRRDRGVPHDGGGAARRGYRGDPRHGAQPHRRGRRGWHHALLPRARRPGLLRDARGRPRRRHHRHRQHPRRRLAHRHPAGVRRDAALGHGDGRRRLPDRPGQRARPAPLRRVRRARAAAHGDRGRPGPDHRQAHRRAVGRHRRGLPGGRVRRGVVGVERALPRRRPRLLARPRQHRRGRRPGSPGAPTCTGSPAGGRGRRSTS